MEYPFGTTSPKTTCTTVESHTLSIQQVEAVSSSEPISTPSSAMNSADDEGADSESSFFSVSKKPRSLRVSLTLPPSVETSPVSSSTQKSPPCLPLPWKQLEEKSFTTPMETTSIAADVDSSPEPSLQIKIEESESEECTTVEDTEPHCISDKEVECIDLDDSSQILPPPLSHNDAGPSPLNNTMTIQGGISQSKPVLPSQNAEAQNIITLSPTQPHQNLSIELPEQPLQTTESSKSDPDVIIIEDNSPQKTNRTHISSSKETLSQRNTTAITPPASDHSSLVKVVAGVTSLMPCKYRRTSVIHSSTAVSPPPPLSTPSPLEQLQMQVKQANQLSRTQSRRNSALNINTNVAPLQKTAAFTPSSKPAAATFASSPRPIAPKKATASTSTSPPLSHINEPSIEHCKSVQQLYSNDIPPFKHHQTEPSPITSSSAVSKASIDERTFSREIISATRSRKSSSTPVHVSYDFIMFYLSSYCFSMYLNPL